MQKLIVSKLSSLSKSFKRDYHTVNILEFDHISAIVSWKQEMTDKIRILTASGQLSEETSEDAIQKISQPFRVYLLEGSASIYTYLWPNNEYKSLIAWGSGQFYASTEDLFWLTKYPFLKKDISSNGLAFSFSSQHHKLYTSEVTTTCQILLSHNLHFGHFVIDDLPTVQLFTQYFPLVVSVSALVQKMHASIIDASSYIISPTSKEVSPSLLPFIESQHNSVITCHEKKHLFQAKTANIYHQAFLSRYFFRSQRLPQSCKSHWLEDSQRTFLYRGGTYLSRISNISEVICLLTDYGFTMIDPTEQKLCDLHNFLRRSRIVISEGGSTGINAAVLTSVSAKVLLLLPANLLKQTSREMIMSGVPYSLAFIDHVDILCGISVINAQNQSSDIVKYDLKNLENWLRQHC